MGEAKRQKKRDKSFGITPGRYNATKMKEDFDAALEVLKELKQNNLVYEVTDNYFFLYENQEIKNSSDKLFDSLYGFEFEFVQEQAESMSDKHGEFHRVNTEDFFMDFYEDFTLVWKTPGITDLVFSKFSKITQLLDPYV